MSGLSSVFPELSVPGSALSPREAAARLCREPGFVWLDSAGNLPAADGDGAFSLLAARPREILRGNLRTDFPLLEDALERMKRERAERGGEPIEDAPAAGLFGTVDYEGGFCFGRYDEALVYRHRSGDWLAGGPELPRLLRENAPEIFPDPPALAFQPSRQAEEYRRMVARAREYIAAGDIYQVNLAHAFSAPWLEAADAFAFALRLREASPAPYAAFLDLGERVVVSSSPESFLKIRGRDIRTRPIKGTRPRLGDPEADERAKRELLASEKERAELLMITDLLRNDLGMVCEYGSVRVEDLLTLERYEQVFHLVSTVRGALRPDVSHPAALAACFPGGSITGAPKKRAMEIIAELEGRPRGLYTGAVGYFGVNGESQFNIAIRTVTIERGRAEFQAGAGIVADSDPEREWEETLRKASGILLAARGGEG